MQGGFCKIGGFWKGDDGEGGGWSCDGGILEGKEKKREGEEKNLTVTDK